MYIDLTLLDDEKDDIPTWMKGHRPMSTFEPTVTLHDINDLRNSTSVDGDGLVRVTLAGTDETRILKTGSNLKSILRDLSTSGFPSSDLPHLTMVILEMPRPYHTEWRHLLG